ncbi:MAG: hypothetical protein J5908_13810, partial [Selenomonas sp.]|nr:hypothetical protein [Selenomonas sp.]
IYPVAKFRTLHFNKPVYLLQPLSRKKFTFFEKKSRNFVNKEKTLLRQVSRQCIIHIVIFFIVMTAVIFQKRGIHYDFAAAGIPARWHIPLQIITLNRPWLAL